jgi:hypothetical protein
MLRAVVGIHCREGAQAGSAEIVTVDQTIGSRMKRGRGSCYLPHLPETIQRALHMVDETSLGFDGQRFDAEVRRQSCAETLPKT